MVQSYSRLAQIYDEFVQADVPAHIKRMKQWLFILFEWMEFDKEDGPVLGLGCGTGNFILALGEFGYDVAGVDFCQDMLDKARESASRLGVKIDLFKQDIRDLHIPRKFGCIFSKQTITHLKDQEELFRVFEGCHRQLVKGGHLVFELPTLYELKSICAGRHEDFRDFSWDSTGVFDEVRESADVEYKFSFPDHTQMCVPMHFKFHPLGEVFKALSQAGFNQVSFLDSNFSLQKDQKGIFHIVYYPIPQNDPRPLNELKSILVHCVSG